AVALAARVQQATQHREQQRAADQADIAAKNARLTQRVQPILDAVRVAHTELRALKRQHELSLTVLSRIDVESDELPVSWSHDVRAAFQREVVIPAGRVLKELDLMI